MQLLDLMAQVPNDLFIVDRPVVERNPSIAQVTADSRLVRPGTLFVAVAGEHFDGHRFIAQAVADGAVAVLGTAPPAQVRSAADPHVPYLQVLDSRLALAHACAALLGHPSRALTIYGVTGTDGKTTTCTILEAILAQATGNRVGLISTIGARIRGRESETGLHVTTPDAPDVQRFLREMCDAGCTSAVVESTSHGLAQGRVAAVEFDVAAVTNITHEHLDYHGTREAYVAAKALLFRALCAPRPAPGPARAAVLNADDPGSYDALRAALAEACAAGGHPVSIYRYGLTGFCDELDVRAVNIRHNAERTTFTIQWWGEPFEVESVLVGDFNMYNVLCAATAALSQGVEPAAIQRGVSGLTGIVGRMERIDRGQQFMAIVDFAHSPASLERALETLRTVLCQRTAAGPPGRLIAVFGSAGLRDREKRRLMGQVSGRLADFTVITAEDPRTEDLNAINQAIAAGVREHAPDSAFAIVPDRGEAIQFAVDMAGPGDIVAAFGKGHERSMCFGQVETPWSDQDAMRAALDRHLAAGAC